MDRAGGRGQILISAELGDHPTWVLDYVIVHELAHLVFPDHSKQFWHLVSAYPKAERARATSTASPWQGATPGQLQRGPRRSE